MASDVAARPITNGTHGSIGAAPPDPEELRRREPMDLHDYLSAAEEIAGDVLEITLPRKAKPLVFRVRMLTDEEYQKCTVDATSFERSRSTGGIRVPEETNAALMRSLIIYTATVDEDRAALWDDDELQRALIKGVLDPNRRRRAVALIDKLIRPGEKVQIINEIDGLGGYNTELEAHAGN